MRSLFRVFLLIFQLATVAAFNFGQVNSGNSLPEGLTGRIMQVWLDAVNSGDEQQIRKFVTEYFSENAFRYQMPVDRYVGLFMKLARQSGGIELVTVTQSTGPGPLTFLVKSRSGDHYAKVRAGLDTAELEKLAGLGIDKAPSPNITRLSEIDEKLTEKESLQRIRKYLDQRAGAGDLSGVVLIARNDTVLFERAYGFANRELKIPVKLETKFHIASVGKLFTAVAIAQIAQRGKLSLDDTVGKLIPEFPNQEIARKVTVRQLLNHTAGMGTFFESPGFVAGRRYPTSASEISVYKDEKLLFEPGTRWRYSNAGYSLLGAIIEKISGLTYLEYVRRNIFGPLGMKDTYTNSIGQTVKGSMVFYTQSPDDPLGLEPFIPDKTLASSTGTGYGGGLSTVGDLLKFARAYRTGRLLGIKTINTLISQKVDQDGSGGARHALGIVETTSHGQTILGHSGGGRCDLEMIWDSDYTVIVMTNSSPPPANSISSEIISFIARQVDLAKR